MEQKFHKGLMWLVAGVVLVCSCQPEADPQPRGVVIGYVGGYRGLVDAGLIDAAKLTHINYAFVDIKQGRAWLTNEATDTINFRTLNALKKKNPDLQILISIGGWSWSENFSDAVLTDSSRKIFAESAVAIVQKYDLDGVDIDWEYPAMEGEEDNIFRPEDKQNCTLMFAALRESLNRLKAQTGKNYRLTTAVGSSSSYIENTEMAKVQSYLDYMNLMTYDFRTEGDTMAGHHANLYVSDSDPDGSSADRSVLEFVAAGVPVEKIVMGVPFYGHAWKVEDNGQHGLGAKVTAPVEGLGYTLIKDSLMHLDGYTRYWDDKAEGPYLYNSKDSIFLSYDDEESVKYKCDYVKKHNLAGIMFWEYFADEKGYLLGEINKDLK